MGTRVYLLAHASTAATAAAAFPADEPLDTRGRAWAEAGRNRLPGADRIRCSPERACRETSAVLDLPAELDTGLSGWDLGEWAGRTLDAVAAEHPAAVTTWFTDPMAVPHGGDSLTELMARVQRWLAEVPDGHTVAVCGPSVVRAAVVGVLGAPAEAFWRLDRWTVRSTGAPVGRRS